MGGTYDAELGGVRWAFHVPLEEQPRHYAAHPPAALGELRATAVELAGHVFDGHGEPVNVVYEVACPCGSGLFSVLGHWSEEAGEFLDPIILVCDACEAWHEVYDCRRHGYDGAVGNNAGVELPPAEAIDDVLAEELDAPHEVLVRFEFPSEHLGDPGLPCAASDLFSWITVLGRDPDDGRIATLFEAECA